MELLRRLQAWFRQYSQGAAAVSFWTGCLLALLATATAFHIWLGVRGDLRAIATVTDEVPAQNAQGLVSYTAHLRFRLPNGELVTFVDSAQGSQHEDPEFVVGRTLPVLYPAASPRAAFIATAWRLYWVSILLGVLAVVLVDIGLILGRVARRLPAQPA